MNQRRRSRVLLAAIVGVAVVLGLLVAAFSGGDMREARPSPSASGPQEVAVAYARRVLDRELLAPGRIFDVARESFTLERASAVRSRRGDVERGYAALLRRFSGGLFESTPLYVVTRRHAERRDARVDVYGHYLAGTPKAVVAGYYLLRLDLEWERGAWRVAHEEFLPAPVPGRDRSAASWTGAQFIGALAEMSRIQ